MPSISPGPCVPLSWHGPLSFTKSRSLCLSDCWEQLTHRSCLLQNICLLPEDPGPGRAAIPSFYFDTITKQCEEFIWGGGARSGNNFATLEECEERCPPIDICLLPEDPGDGRAAIPSFYFDTITKQCEEFIWGGGLRVGNNFATLGECEERCPPVDICLLPEEPGPGDESITSFYFDTITRQCEEFIWGGGIRFGNNFATLGECQERCPPIDICLLPEEPGPGDESILSFYFDTITGRCEEFIWGGGTRFGNNFATLEDCEATCDP